MAAHCRFEAIQRQIKLKGGNMKRGRLEPGSLIVEVFDPAGVNAANTVNVKHRQLMNLKALQGSTLDHRNIPKKFLISGAGRMQDIRSRAN
jgi:hypothetical protein